MVRVLLGRTGIEVSDFCLGTDYYGSRISPDMAWQLLDAFAEAGGRFVDTANMYGAFIPGFVGGESESVIGGWMAARGNRDAIVVATKVAGPYKDVPGGLRATDVARECEKSLRRLQSPTIDLYYAHVDDRTTPLEEILHGFEQLLATGKIRSVGLSNWQLWRLAEARLLAEIAGWPVAALEYRHTYLRPTASANFEPQIAATPELFDFARAHGLTVVAYSVLLNGAYTRRDRPIPWGYRGPDTDARLACIREIAAELGATTSQVVLAWLRSTPGCAVIPIIGGSTLEQLQENLMAGAVRLSRDHQNRLDAAGTPQPDVEGESP
ncbi:MAG TPA: aldo/keto reductase [Propionibacteriaceae bacterium]|nr:aldo/keto reductase [Propionibacteriaceae bacterium]